MLVAERPNADGVGGGDDGSSSDGGGKRNRPFRCLLERRDQSTTKKSLSMMNKTKVWTMEPKLQESTNRSVLDAGDDVDGGGGD